MVAAVTHAATRPELPKMTATWVSKDPPDLDNTLNMLSALSFPLAGATTWASPGALLKEVLRTAVLGQGIILPPGGNSPAGVLGQIGGMLELADQIESGEVDDIDAIVLPVGSSCTISGLVIGVALARRLGLRGFNRPGFRCTFGALLGQC